MPSHRRIDRSSPIEAPVNEAGAPAAAPETPAPSAAIVPSGPIMRLKVALARTSKAWRTRQLDVGSALHQRSRFGRSVSPAQFLHVEQEPLGTLPHLPRHARPPGTARQLTDTAIAKTSSGQPVDDAAARNESEFLSIDEIPHALRTPNDLRDYVRSAFDCAGEQAFLADGLAARLHRIAYAQSPSPASTGHAALVVQAMRQARVDDIQCAWRVLGDIAALDFDRPHARHSQSEDEYRAWHLVRILARSNAGLSMLEQIRADAGAPARDEHHRRALAILFESAAALESAARIDGEPAAAPDYAPGAVVARMGLRQSSLAADEPGPAALAKRAFDAAATLIERGSVALTPDQFGALFAWEQGFREDDRHSDFSQTRARLSKFLTKTIPRVEDKRWKTLVPRMFSSKRATPLSALRFGTLGVPRKTVAREHAALREGMRAALPRLVNRPAMQPAAALSHVRAQRSMVELAALQVWLEHGGFRNQRMTKAALRDVAQHAHAMCNDLAGKHSGTRQQGRGQHRLERLREASAKWITMSADELANTRPFSKIAKQPFNVKRLEAWGKVADVPKNDSFWPIVKELEMLEHPPSAATKARSIASVRETLLEVVEGLQSGQTLRLSDGNHKAVSTRGLNVTTRLVAGSIGVPVSPRLDLRASRTHQQEINISRRTDSVELFFGTTKTTEHQIGAGLLLGYDIDVGLTDVRAGIVTNATLHAHEISKPRGVSIRVIRRMKADGTGYDDETMRRKQADVVGYLFDEAATAHDDGPDGMWNRFAQRYWDDPDISISWTESESNRMRRGVTVDLTGTVQFHPGDPGDLTLRAGPSIGIGWERSRETTDLIERTGRLQVEQHRVSVGSLWTGRGGIAPGFSHPLSGTGHVSIGLFSIDALSYAKRLDQRNHAATLRLVRENGSVSALLDVEFLHADNYLRAVQASRSELVSLFAADFRGQPDLDAPPGILAERRIDKHMAAVNANRGAHLSYVQRYRLQGHAEDKLKANADRLKQAGNDPRVMARIEADNERILDDRSSWMLVELKVRERNTRASSVGPRLMVHFNTRTSATGDREIITENVPLQVLEQLDSPRR